MKRIMITLLIVAGLLGCRIIYKTQTEIKWEKLEKESENQKKIINTTKNE